MVVCSCVGVSLENIPHSWWAVSIWVEIISLQITSEVLEWRVSTDHSASTIFLHEAIEILRYQRQWEISERE